jgi:hypothetical protein
MEDGIRESEFFLDRRVTGGDRLNDTALTARENPQVGHVTHLFDKRQVVATEAARILPLVAPVLVESGDRRVLSAVVCEHWAL